MFLGLNLDQMVAWSEQTKAVANELLGRAAEDLAAMAYNKVVEQAQQQLHATRQTYLDNLSYEQASPSTWTVTLQSPAMWIEEGMPRHEMVDDLVKGGRVSKKGTMYKVIPFPIKGPSQTSPKGMPIRVEAMRALKEARVNMRRVERDANGNPKIGTLHSLDVTGGPLKTAEGAFQGHGPIGAVRQGMGGTPFLKGMRVMQRQVGIASPIIKREAMTFRVVSTIHKGTGRWVHPGIKANKFMDKAFEWAKSEWETKVKPEVMSMVQEAMGARR